MDYCEPRLPCEPTQIGRWFKRLKNAVKRQRTILGVVMREVQRKWLDRRHAIEPLIGHSKSDWRWRYGADWRQIERFRRLLTLWALLA